MGLHFSFLSTPGTVVYPWASVKLKEEGSVGLKLYISKTGEILNSEITTTSGYKYLDKAALDSVSTLVVDTSKIDQEVGEERNIKITFTLSDQ